MAAGPTRRGPHHAPPEGLTMARTLGWVALAIVALLVVGSIVVWLLKALLSLAFYLVVGALVVGGCWYLYRRMASAARGGAR
jgi:hypothetical protein